MRFGFMPGKGTTNTVLTLRRLQEEYRAEGENWGFLFWLILRRPLIEFEGAKTRALEHVLNYLRSLG